MYRHLSPTDKAIEHRHLEQILNVYPDLEISSKHFNTDGFANDIITINEKTIFRFPKFSWALEDMYGEARCLEVAKLHTTMRLPSWTIHNDTFISYQKIQGDAMHRWRLQKEAPEHIAGAAHDLGTFLNELHSIPMKELSSHSINPSSVSQSYDDWLKMYDDIQQELFPIMTSSTQDWVETLFRTIIADNTLMDYSPRLVVGELTSSHIIFNYEKKSISGIIDFRTSGIADPAVDIAYIFEQYGESFVEMMQQTYQGSKKLMTRARFIAETLPLQWALGGFRTGNPYWYLIDLGRERGFRSAYIKP